MAVGGRVVTQRVAGVLWTEKRTAKRYVTSLEIAFVWQGRQFRAIGVDISMTGMRFASEVDLGAGSQLVVHFALPGAVEMHQLSGRVVWTRASREVLGLFDAGIEFTTLTKEAHNVLACLVRELGHGNEPDDLPLIDGEHVVDIDDNGRAKKVAFSASEPTVGRVAGGSPEAAWKVARRLDVAIAKDTKARKDNLRRAEDVASVARAAVKARDFASAVPKLREVVTLLPESPEAHEELAAALYHVGEVRESAAIFDRALRLRLERGGD
jgi:hypothetical protein